MGQITKLRKFDADGASGRTSMTAFVTDRSKLNDPGSGSWTEDLTFDEAAALHKDPTLAPTFERSCPCYSKVSQKSKDDRPRHTLSRGITFVVPLLNQVWWSGGGNKVDFRTLCLCEPRLGLDGFI